MKRLLLLIITVILFSTIFSTSYFFLEDFDTDPRPDWTLVSGQAGNANYVTTGGLGNSGCLSLMFTMMQTGTMAWTVTSPEIPAIPTGSVLKFNFSLSQSATFISGHRIEIRVNGILLDTMNNTNTTVNVVQTTPVNDTHWDNVASFPLTEFYGQPITIEWRGIHGTSIMQIQNFRMDNVRIDAGSGQLNVVLSSFTAVHTVNETVNIGWITSSESNLIGFNIRRNTVNDKSEAINVNDHIIPARNTSLIQSYQFTDNTDINDGVYWYWLQIAHRDGTFTYSEPIPV